MPRDAGEPSAKRAKADEADDKEEDALVRRREELALSFVNARAKGEELGARLVREAEEEVKRLWQKFEEEAQRLKREAEEEAQRLEREANDKARRLRAKQEDEVDRLVDQAKEKATVESEKTLNEAKLSFGQDLHTVCAALEAKNEKRLSHFRRLPPDLWQKIVDEYLHLNDLLALAMTCRLFREKQKDLGRKLVTDVKPYRLLRLRKSGKVASHTLGWFQWVCDTLEILPGFQDPFSGKRVKGAVYEGDLLNYAAFQGSAGILRWLIEEKGWETNWRTGEWAGMGGSIEVLEHLRERGYEFDWMACGGAARGGCLEALKFLRGLDPPCPWNEWTCAYAAQGGHLKVLKFLRAQNPPCPWDEETCSRAAYGGHLDVLKWLRDQDPPCPWDEETCYRAAYGGHLDVLKWARSQNPPCPWSRRECKENASRGGQHIVEWIDRQEED